MLHWLALNLSEALSFRSSHVSLSTWVSRPASLSRSLRGSQTNYATTDCAALLRSARLTIGWHPSQICLQEGLVRLAEWHRYRHTYRVIRRRDPLAGDLSRRSKPGQARNLAGSGPQLACGRWNGGSPGALDAGRRRRGFHGVDLLNAMPLPDSAANAGTPMPKNIGAHEGRSLRANNSQI